ncbi:MAG: DUF1016 N-terminal domain-containing protein [Butyrivibrio sp.]|nr:DUF1016 N-terminal domain-containing protein [Muribaculum sp.]MCM1552400.1 DUF1016 N-terminal domain-containing protein [Butyrivibrio sp.]
MGIGKNRNNNKGNKFYLTYSSQISETVFSLFAIQKSETVFRLFEKELPFTLPWSHYLQLMRIKDENERKFYEIDATHQDLDRYWCMSIIMIGMRNFRRKIQLLEFCCTKKKRMLL